MTLVHELVVLQCGHWFTEHRPISTANLDPGEPRACGHQDHYPAKFVAVYYRLPEGTHNLPWLTRQL